MRILIVGDAHGDKVYIHWMYRKASQVGATKIVQLGDLAWCWPGKTGRKLPQWLATGYDLYGIEFYFIDGNHDNHDELDHDAETFVQVADGSFYVPRGHSWTWGKRKFVAIGGAYSVDQADRIPGHTWWSNEQPNLAQFYRARDAESCDILFTHEAPGTHVRNNHHMYDLVEFPAVLAQRHDLAFLVSVLKPAHVYHGHWHMRYEDERVFGAQIHGTGANVAYWPDRADWNKAYYILDIPDADS